MWKMSAPPSYEELLAEVTRLTSELGTFQCQVQAKKAHGLVLDSEKMLAPELFTGTHDGEMVRTFLNACSTYFKLTGIQDENKKALFAKTCLSNIAHIWYDSQRYDETLVTFVTLKSHILDYFIPFDYVRRARRALVACKMG